MIAELRQKIEDFNIIYEGIGSPKRATKKNLSSSTSPDEVEDLAREIILLNRSIQHIEGTERIIETIKDDSAFMELGVEVSDPVYLEGAWATAPCKISTMKIKSPASVGEAWAFVSEGTTSLEQNIYYGMTDSLGAVKKLFGGEFYRATGKTPNIKEMNVFMTEHALTPKHIKGSVKNGWSEAEKTSLADEPAYQAIADYFAQIIDGGTYEKTVISQNEVDVAENAEAEADAQSDKMLGAQPDEATKAQPDVIPGMQEKPSPQPEFSTSPQPSEAPVEQNLAQPSETIMEQNPVPQGEVVAQSEETTTTLNDRALFNAILSNSDISKRGRHTIQNRNHTLRQLAHTPKSIMQKMLSEPDIRRVAQILDENGHEHPKWFD